MSFDPVPGARLGPWRLVGSLGSGAFAATWAVSGPDGEPAAVKLLDRAPGEELRALSRVCHPCVVGVQGFGTVPTHYLVLDLVAGRTLTRVIQAGPHSDDQVVAVLAPLADALAAVHGAGVVHGDVKPDNVLLSDTGLPVLVDFGMAGHRLGGTLTWASPERTRGEPSSPAGDVHALGLLAWTLLHGSLPFADDGVTRAMLRRRTEQPVPTRGAPWLRELIASLLSVVPADRPSAAQVATRLADRGAVLPSVGVDLVARRLASVHVQRPGVQPSLDRWILVGGRLALVGGRQLGKSHALAWAAREAGARGRVLARLEGEWGAVQALLDDPDLCSTTVRLPAEPDPALRAALVATHLQEHGRPGMVVVVDDLESAGQATRQVVRALAERTSVPLLVTAVDPPEGFESVTLAPWARADLGALIDRGLGSVASRDALLDELEGFCEGRPGAAVRLLLEGVRTEGLLVRDHRWLLDREAVVTARQRASAPLPLLSEAARAVASVLGATPRPLDRAALAHGLGLDQQVAADAVGQLADAHLVEIRGASLVLRPSARASVQAAVPPDPHAWRVLVRLLRSAEAGAVELAPALGGAGDVEGLVALAPEAVAQARALDASEAVALARGLRSAADHPVLERCLLQALAGADAHEEVVQRGLLHLEAHPDDLDVVVVVANALVLLDDPKAGLELLGDRGDIRSLAVRALAWARQGQPEAARALELPAPPASAELLDAWFDLRVQLAQCLSADGDLAGALRVATVESEVGAGTVGRAKLLAVRGRVLFQDGSIRSAAEAFLAAADSGSGLAPRQSAIVLNNAAAALYLSGERDEAIASWEQATLRFERMGYDTGVVLSQVNLSNALREDGRWERARQCGVRAWELARELGLFGHAVTAAGNLGDLGMVRGRWVDAESWYSRADQLSEQHGLTAARVENARRRAELALRRGDDDAEQRTRHAVDVAAEQADALEHALASALMALCAARAHAPLDAHVTAAIEPLRERGAARELARARCWVAEALGEAGRTTEALAVARRALAYAREVGDVPVRRHAEAIESRVQAVAHAALRDPRADRLLDLAVEVTRETDTKALLARVASATLAVVGAERAFVYLLVDGAPQLMASEGQNLEPGPSRSILQRALDGREVVATDVEERGDLQAASSVRRMELRAALCLPISDHGEVLGAIYADSTQAGERELHQMARLLRALASQAAVAVLNARRLQLTSERARELAELAHDLRAPLSCVTMLLEAFRDRPEPWFHQLSSDLSELAQRGQDMITEHLSPDERSAELLDLLAVTRRCLALTEPLAAARGVRLQAEGDALQVLASGVQVARVIDNLVGNALKYAPPDSTVAVRIVAEASDALVLISDRGPGIPAAAQQRIFEFGYQAPGAAEGFGLGLAATLRIVRRLGGDLAVRARDGGGTVVEVRLPRA